MSIEFTRKAYLEVWQGTRYISRHTGVLEAGESASSDAEINGPGSYDVKVGVEIFYEIVVSGTVSVEPPLQAPSLLTVPDLSVNQGVDMSQYIVDPDNAITDSQVLGLTGSSTYSHATKQLLVTEPTTGLQLEVRYDN